MLKISNFHVFQMFGSTEGLPIPYRGRSAKKKEKQRLSGFDWHFRTTTHTPVLLKPSCTVCVFRWAGERRGGKKVPAPAIRQLSAINREPQHDWFMMLAALMASSNTAWLESPHILIFHPPLGTDFAFPSSLITSFSDLHLLFQSWFPGPFYISLAISAFHESCQCF